MHQGMAALSPGTHWGNPPPSTARAGKYLYIHSDHLNTPKVVSDQNQQVVWKADYEPFGKVTETISTVEMPLRYPGQIADEETGLSYNWNRSYNPATGRYTQSDPIGIYGGLNTYGYVFQNPLRLTDPTGESPVALCPILIVADGPFPVGDIACGCLIVATAAAAINAANGTGEALNNPAVPANCPNPPDDDGSGGSCGWR